MKKIFILCLIAVLVLNMQAQSKRSIRNFVCNYMQTYPKAQLCDIYKSSYHDFMGGEHWVEKTDVVKQYIETELAEIETDKLQAWYFEPCGIEGRYVRLSLKAITDSLISVDMMVDVFVRSSQQESCPPIDAWRERWHRIVAVIDKLKLQIADYEYDKQRIEELLASGKYVTRHSQVFRDTYHPHYRVVKKEIFEQEILPLLKHR